MQRARRTQRTLRARQSKTAQTRSIRLTASPLWYHDRARTAIATLACWHRTRRSGQRRAGRRCGKGVMRRWMTGCKSSRIGIWQRNRHPTLMSISASIGDWLRWRFGLAGGQAACATAPKPTQSRLVACRFGTQQPRPLKPQISKAFGCQKTRCHADPHAVEFPIRKTPAPRPFGPASTARATARPAAAPRR